MRGKVLATLPVLVLVGITPAYAGKSHVARPDFVPTWDHPRVCGEKYMTPFDDELDQGSPPRMRGKDLADCPASVPPGITPAYAGKSNALLNLPAGQRDHPRVCGEKEAAALSEVYETGSPPRMRGKVRPWSSRGLDRWITPAYAGKSLWWPPAGGLAQDHPRVCGEKPAHA